ncbi:MAG: beta-propeller fold lactonase family protein [Terracidiphilus sp.]
MKFNKSRQLLLTTAASLLAAGLIAACGTATADFVYVASSKAAGPYNYGEIDVFEINRISGAMRQIPASPFPSGGRNPVAEAVSSDDTNLYVVNQDDNTIVQFLIGSDGKIYPQNTVNTPGVYPQAVAVNGSTLFIADTYQPLPTCSNANPCSGSVAVFPIEPASGTGSSAKRGGALGVPAANGSLNYWPLCLYGYVPASGSTQCVATSAGGVHLPKASDVMVPTAVSVLSSGGNAYFYVTAFDWTAGGGAFTGIDDILGTVNVCNQKPSAYYGDNGYIFGFSAGSGGALSPLNGGAPFASAGLTLPCGIASASDASGAYVYVTDSTNGNVHGYSVASGALTELSGSPYAAGNQPAAIVADPDHPFLYVANALDGTVSAYSIGSGALTGIGTYDAGIQPVAMGIDPSTSHFLFTVNFLGSNVSDFQLSTTAGTLINTQRSPYVANAQPTAVTAIPHHATQ